MKTTRTPEQKGLLAATAKLDTLRADMQTGINELDAGKGAPLDMEDIKRRVIFGTDSADGT